MKRRALAAALIFGLVGLAWQAILGMVAAPPSGRMFGDSTEYLHLAANLLDGRGYCYDPGFLSVQTDQERMNWMALHRPRGLLSLREDTDTLRLEHTQATTLVPTHMRQPMYPLFLAAIFLASGFRPVALFVAQAVLVVITCILAYLIAGRLWPGLRGGRPLAALSVLLFVPLALTSSLVMADALMVCLVVASYYLVVRLDENGRTSDAVLGGLLMSLAVLTKPIALSYSVFVTVPLLWRLFRRRNILPLVCLLASFLLPLAAWALRNKLVCGSLTPFSTESGNNLWAGTYDPLSPFAIVFLDAPDDRLQQIVGGDYYINERAYDKLLRAAWQRIRHDPGGYVVRGVSRVVRVGLLDFPGGRSVLGRRPVVYRFSQLSMAVLWALFAIGLVNANHIRYILLSGPATIVSACLVMWCPARAFLPCDVLLLTGATAGVIVLYGRLRIAKGTYARTPQADQRLP